MNLTLFSDLVFRANPSYVLMSADDWGDPESAGWPDDAYGVVLPKKGRVKKHGRTDGRIVTTQQALLLHSLKKPGGLPFFYRRFLSTRDAHELGQLILGDFLEVETPEGFKTGAAAAAYLAQRERAEQGEKVRNADNLSLRALRYVETWLKSRPLEDDSVRLATNRLYHYNTIPLSAKKGIGLETAEQVYAFLRIDEIQERADSAWGFEAAQSNGWWHYWSRPGGSRFGAFDVDRFDTKAGDRSCKLYISPRPADLPEVLAKSVTVLQESEAMAFKVGANRTGVLRPDKLVAYFSDFSTMMEAAENLRSTHGDFEAQGVPFTCNIVENGLLSWGVDPSDDLPNYDLYDDGGGSWRSWISEELAKSLVHACASPESGMSAHEYALLNIQLAGVDTDRWALANRIDSQAIFA